MDESEKELIQEKKDKLEKILKDKYSLGIFGILLLAFALRIYYFSLTKAQVHWWDSLAYGSLAKNAIFDLWSETPFILHETIIRAPLLSLIWKWLLNFGFSDAGIILISQLIPSMLSVFLIYLIGKELYSKKVGLIAAFIMAISWLNIFYMARIMTDIPAMCFSLLSIYFFIKSYRKLDAKLFFFSIFALSLAVLTRNISGLIGIAYLIFLTVIHGHKFLLKKGFYLGGIFGITPLILFFLSNLTKFGNVFPALEIYAASSGDKPGNAYYIITNFFPHILQNYLLAFLILGLGLLILELVLGYDLIRRNKKLQSHLLIFLISMAFIGYFIFGLKAAEDRYLLVPMALFGIVIGNGLMFVFYKVGKYNKTFAIVLLVIFLGLFANSQLTYGNTIIENGVNGFKTIDTAFLWIKDSTPKDAKIFGHAIDPYVIYYSERALVIGDNKTLEEQTSEADYIILHALPNQAQELVNYVNENPDLFTIEQAFFFDSQQQQPSVIIYKVNK